MNQIATMIGEHYSAAQLGMLDDLYQYKTEIAAIPGRPVPGKLFLNDVLGLTGMEVSLNKLPAGAKVPFYHTHRQHEELYLFLKGSGQFQIDGEIIDVREGTAIRVAPEGVRTWRNHSTEDLYYIVIQAQAGTLAALATDDGVVLERKVEWPDA